MCAFIALHVSAPKLSCMLFSDRRTYKHTGPFLVLFSTSVAGTFTELNCTHFVKGTNMEMSLVNLYLLAA